MTCSGALAELGGSHSTLAPVVKPLGCREGVGRCRRPPGSRQDRLEECGPPETSTWSPGARHARACTEPDTSQLVDGAGLPLVALVGAGQGNESSMSRSCPPTSRPTRSATASGGSAGGRPPTFNPILVDARSGSGARGCRRAHDAAGPTDRPASLRFSMVMTAPMPAPSRPSEVLAISGDREVRHPCLLTTSVHQPDRALSWPEHQHPEHELLWTDRGVVTMEAGGHHWTETPGVGLRVPAGTSHKGRTRERSAVRTTYFAPRDMADSIGPPRSDQAESRSPPAPHPPRTPRCPKRAGCAPSRCASTCCRSPTRYGSTHPSPKTLASRYSCARSCGTPATTARSSLYDFGSVVPNSRHGGDRPSDLDRLEARGAVRAAAVWIVTVINIERTGAM